MKKIMLIAVTLMLVSVNAFALDGKIGKVNFAATGLVWVEIVTDSSATTKKIVGSVDVQKAMTAAILTAKAQNSDVRVFEGTVDAETGWKSIILL